MFAHIKVLRLKSDRLSMRKKKTSCFFLIHKTTSQSRKKVASLAAILRVKGETAMKKKYKITIIGTPNIEKISTAEQKSFYSTLLSIMTEYPRSELLNDNANAPDCSENANDINSEENESPRTAEKKTKDRQAG